MSCIITSSVHRLCRMSTSWWSPKCPSTRRSSCCLIKIRSVFSFAYSRLEVTKLSKRPNWEIHLQRISLKLSLILLLQDGVLSFTECSTAIRTLGLRHSGSKMSPLAETHTLTVVMKQKINTNSQREAVEILAVSVKLYLIFSRQCLAQDWEIYQ